MYYEFGFNWGTAGFGHGDYRSARSLVYILKLTNENRQAKLFLERAFVTAAFRMKKKETQPSSMIRQKKNNIHLQLRPNEAAILMSLGY